MVHRWQCLTFLHWAYPPEVVQRLLPPSLSVEAYQGSAWVGLVPFRMDVRLPHLPAVPWASHFPETNVRTYVTGPDGSTGVWFLSLDAARLGAVLVARAGWRLPYLWSAMAVEEEADGVVRYRSRRRWPGPRGTRCVASVKVGSPFAPDELTDFDHYLTARYGLFSAPARGLWYARAHHERWPLRRVELVDLDQSVLEAAGLPNPSGEPVMHWSSGVTVRIGWPHRVTGGS